MTINNIAQTALIICQNDSLEDWVNRPLLGLTIGERLLLSLHKGGITKIAFVGDTDIAQDSNGLLETITIEQLPQDEEEFIIVPSDLVFDPAMLSCPQSIPKNYPIHYCKAAELDEVLSSIARRPGTGDSSSSSSSSSSSLASGHNFAIRVIDKKTAALAEDSLLLSLGKSADGMISRHLNRKISTAISRRLAPYPVSPNQITAVVFLLGIISGPLAWLGSYAGFALGGLCYWLSAVLDGCDGEISRLKYQGSPLGAWLDTIVDDLVCFSYITGMYIALSRNADHPYWFWCGIIAIFFYLVTLLPRYYVMAFRSGSGDYQKIAKEQRPAEFTRLSKISFAIRDIFFRTDFMSFSAMITAFIAFVPAFALPFAIGTIATAIDSLISLCKYEKTQEPG